VENGFGIKFRVAYNAPVSSPGTNKAQRGYAAAAPGYLASVASSACDGGLGKIGGH
jgi:hypothetical protein